MRYALHGAAAFAVASFATPALAATHIVNPTSLTLALTRAAPGDTIKLTPGNYEDVSLPARDHRPAVVIDATGATVRSVTVRNTAGWVWRGGRIVTPLPPVAWRNVMIDNARRIEIVGATLTGGHTGVLVTRGSEDVTLRNNVATGLQSDGFNIVTARRVSLIGNTCSNFRPILPVYSASGALLKDGTHPDCIMLWSEANRPPTSDIVITGNRMSGTMQGIAHFYHPQLGRPPVYNLTVNDNIVDVTYWHGITLQHTVGAQVKRNKVSSTAGARTLGFPFGPVRTWLKAEGTGIAACGNFVEDYPGGTGTKPCP